MVSFSEVERMLEKCAPAHTIELKTHFRIIRWNQRTYPTFPKHDEVEAGHARKMARVLGILACAKEFLKI
jgi:hypothetical protein